MFNQRAVVEDPGFSPYQDFGREAAISEITGSSGRANSKYSRVARNQVKLKQWFSMGMISLCPGKTFGNVNGHFGCHMGVGENGVTVEVRVPVKHSAMHKPTSNKDLSSLKCQQDYTTVAVLV